MRRGVAFVTAASVILLVLLVPYRADSAGRTGITPAMTVQPKAGSTSPVQNPDLPPVGIRTSGTPTVFSLMFSPQHTCGEPSIGRINLSTPAPAGGAKVTVTSGNPSLVTIGSAKFDSYSAAIPSVYTIPEGQQSVTFEAYPVKRLTSTQNVIITADCNGQKATAAVIVFPQELRSLIIKNKQAYSNYYIDVVVEMTGKTGVVNQQAGLPLPLVNITSSDTAATTFSNLPAGYTNAVPINTLASTGAFRILTGPVAATKTVTIFASYNGKTISDTLTISPVPITSFMLNPDTTNIVNDPTNNMYTVNGSITVGAAPLYDTTYTLTSSDPGIINILPSASGDMKIPAGKTSGTFVLSPSTVSTRKEFLNQDRTVTITADYRGQKTTKLVTVLWPRKVTAFSISPKIFRGGLGSPFSGKVTLDTPAPRGGLVLTVNGTKAQGVVIPTSVIVPEGKTEAAFTCSAVSWPGSPLEINIWVSNPNIRSMNPVQPLKDTCFVYPVTTIQSLSFNNYGNGRYQGLIYMSADTLPDGEDIKLQVVNPGTPPGVSVPASVRVKGRSAYFDITATPVTAAKEYTVKATYDGKDTIAMLKLVP